MSEPSKQVCIINNRYTSDYSRWGGQECYKSLLDGPDAILSSLPNEQSKDWCPLPTPHDEPWEAGYANLDGGYFIDFDFKTLMFFSYGMSQLQEADIVRVWQGFRTYTPEGNEYDFWDALADEMNRSVRNRGSAVPHAEDG